MASSGERRDAAVRSVLTTFKYVEGADIPDSLAAVRRAENLVFDGLSEEQTRQYLKAKLELLRTYAERIG